MRNIIFVLLIEAALIGFSLDASAADNSSATTMRQENLVEVNAIKEVALKFALEQVYSPDEKLKIKVDNVIGIYAKATVIPADASRVEGARAFLKKTNGKWIVTDMGTGATPDKDFPRFPKN